MQRKFEVTVEQIREFVITCTQGTGLDHTGNWISVPLLIDFIDNGPKKPTAEEIARAAFEKRTGEYDPIISVGIDAAMSALREAGLLKKEKE